jgi:hypothetical protein
VFGAGSQGLLLTMALAARGMAPHVVDPQRQRLDLARELGARAASVEAPEGTVLGCGLRNFWRAGCVDCRDRRRRHRARPSCSSALVITRSSWTPCGSSVSDCVFKVRSSTSTPRTSTPLSTSWPTGPFHPGRVIKRAFALSEADQALRTAPTLPGKSLIAVSAREDL